MRRPTALLLAAALLGVLASPALAARTYPVNVAAKLRGPVAKLKRHRHVPILLPGVVRSVVHAKRAFGSGGAIPKGYDLELGIGRGCDGANYCMLGAFLAWKGNRMDRGGHKARLRGGIPARWWGIQCGASCSKPRIEFRRRGVLYYMEWLVPQGQSVGRTLVRLANSALAHGPR